MNVQPGDEIKNVKSITGEKIVSGIIFNVLERTTIVVVGNKRVMVKNEELMTKGYCLPKFNKVPFTHQA